MNIKKLLALQLLMLGAITQSYDFPKYELKNKDLQTIAASGLLVSAIACTTYIWATSGDSVEQRIQDAQQVLATMPEYEQDLDTTTLPGEKETQIIKNLEILHIDLKNFTDSYHQKLQDDLTTLQKTYDNLWYKSFYGGQNIVNITRKIYEIKTKIESLVKYLQTHQRFMHGHKIMNEAPKLLSRSSLQNHDEVMKTAKLYDAKSAYPLFMYVKKIQKDLECIEFFISQKAAQQDYPQLSAMILQYQPKLEEIKSVLCAMETYKIEALSKLENDIVLLTEKCEKLEQLIIILQHEVQMLQMRN
ncbi:MAG: hypothetical protein Q8Q60_05205 [Candidatus Chromulinivorax sp.]|nr:hypothetical protein [Candidatus Chromulinivorax sp.]